MLMFRGRNCQVRVNDENAKNVVLVPLSFMILTVENATQQVGKNRSVMQ